MKQALFMQRFINAINTARSYRKFHHKILGTFHFLKKYLFYPQYLSDSLKGDIMGYYTSMPMYILY